MFSGTGGFFLKKKNNTSFTTNCEGHTLILMHKSFIFVTTVVEQLIILVCKTIQTKQDKRMKNSNKKQNINKLGNTDETYRNKVSSNEHYDLRVHNIEISEQGLKVDKIYFGRILTVIIAIILVIMSSMFFLNNLPA